MQLRKSPREANLLEVYYCIDGILCQAPNILELIQSRISKTSFYMNDSFNQLHGSIDYSSKNGHKCWTNLEIENNENVNDNNNDGNNVENDQNNDKKDDNKSIHSIINIREFPSFSRMIDDLNTSF